MTEQTNAILESAGELDAQEVARSAAAVDRLIVRHEREIDSIDKLTVAVRKKADEAAG